MKKQMFDLSFYKNKRVLITGHTGFKGTWMCKVLLQAGAVLTGYALNPPTSPGLFDLCGVEKQMNSIYGDIRDLEHLRSVFEEFQPEIVIHMAAQPLVRTSYEEPVYTYDVNVMGTVNVLECVRTCESVKSFLNVTTDKVYRNKEREQGYREDEELNGFDPYSNSKSCSELVTASYVNSFLKEKGVAVSTARAGNVIGGGDFAKNRIVPDCVRAAEAMKPIVIRNPESVRPYQHVLEPVLVYLMICAAQYQDASLCGSYNVGPDESECLQTAELTKLFCECWGRETGKKPEWCIKSDGGPHEAGYLKLDCSRLKQSFGWHPVWNLQKTMEKIVQMEAVRIRGKDLAACMEKQITEFLKEAES